MKKMLLALGMVAMNAWASPFDGISREVPKSWPCAEFTRGDVRAVWLEGEPSKGKPTKVFAYVVLPKGASAGKKVPGMVLAHGGAGSAYADWARRWAARGYAAIIPDNCGCIPVKAPGADWMASGVGGPLGWGRIDLAEGPVGEQWPYHAVGALIRAHSYLRSLPEVDAGRIGLTGISWGGFLTMLTASADNRFRFAAPVYACGFYEEFAAYTDFYKSNSRSGLGVGPEGERLLKAWAKLFDPKHYVAEIKMPLFWFVSTNDRAFPFDTTQKTVRLAEGARLATRLGMLHGHGKVGETMPELFLFADQMLRGGAVVPSVAAPEAKDGVFTVRCLAGGYRIRRAELIWCAEDRPLYGTKWSRREAAVSADGVVSERIPAEARRVYVNYIFGDELKGAYYPDAIVSSQALMRP